MYVDPIVKEYMRTYQPEGRFGYVRLDQNENPDGVPKWLFDEVMNKITPEYLGMYPEEQAITERYAKLFGLAKESVKFTDGSVVAMSYVIKVFGEPGKNLVCVNPTFGMYKVYADLKGMNTVFVPYEEDFTFDINKLIDTIDERTGIVSLVNPNMPIGNAYARNQVESVIEKAQKHDALVVIDEAYYHFYEHNSLDLISKYKNVIILRTFSKMFSLSGLRIGVVLSSPENMQYIRNYMPHYTVNCVALAFVDAIIENHDRVLGELLSKFKAGKEFLLNALEDNDYSYLPTNGCFLCIRPKYKTAEQITDELKLRNILIFCGKGGSAGFLRVTIWDKKYMEAFMSALLDIDR